MAPAAIEVGGLTKKYGRKTVVDAVSFSVPAGSVCGLVGPNGAGKTTVMSMLLGLVRPSAGTATVLDGDIGQPQSYLHRVGALIEYPAFFPGLSGKANLEHMARLGGHDRSELGDLLELVGLSDRGDDRFGSYSLGMKQRLGIAGALVGDPDLVVLDEPTNGVDPQGMKDIRGIIREIAQGGRTVLVSSHLMAELEAVCDHLVVLQKGGCRYSGTVEGLGSHRTTRIEAAATPSADLADALSAAGLQVAVSGRGVEIESDGADAVALAAHINSVAHSAGIVLTELHQKSISLEDKVLELVSTGAQS